MFCLSLVGMKKDCFRYQQAASRQQVHDVMEISPVLGKQINVSMSDHGTLPTTIVPPSRFSLRARTPSPVVKDALR